MSSRFVRNRIVVLVCLIAALCSSQAAQAADAFPVSIRVDAGAPLGELKPIWRFFGCDEPNYATMKHGQKLIGELGELKPKEVFFRAHNLLCTGDGTPALKWGSTNAYREDENGNAIYDWTILDQIFDTYLQRGVRPYVQIGFMPKDLSTQPEPYQHSWTPRARYEEIYTGWAYPPKSYDKWGELAYQWAKHCIERYGREEVETWYWQVWNEANIGYWRGTPEEFLKLHDYAIAGVRRALPTAKVGGADTAGDGGRFTRRFIEHCLGGTNFATGEKGTPLDFVSFHAKGAPRSVDGHVRMGIANQLITIDRGFEIMASYPETKTKPIVIGESDPEGCAACQGPQLAYRNGTMYSSYTAASFTRKLDLAAKHGVNFEGALTWAFEFEGHPYFAGFRSLATNGIDKPVLNVFRMFSKMSGKRLTVDSDRAVSLERIVERGVRRQPDVSALAALNGNTLTAMVWHYHDDDVPGPDADIKLSFENLPVQTGRARIEHYRIDEEHSNAYTAWLRMGSPKQPTDTQYAELDKADQLAKLDNAAAEANLEDGKATVGFNLPRKGVSLLVINLEAAAAANDESTSASSERRVEPVPDAVREKFNLDPFYQQYVDAGGLPILSSAKVSPAGLLEAAYLIDQMLANREDVRQELIKRRVRFVVMAPTEMTTDVPEQSHMDKEYWDRRARGLGGRICSCGEENLLNLPGDRYRNENILIHEFSHTIHNYGLRRLDEGFQKRLTDLYNAAKDKELWKNTYAMSNPEEYWAEAVQSYFDCNAPPRRRVHNDIDTREELKAYDPELFQLIDESFKSPQWRYVRYDNRHSAAAVGPNVPASVVTSQ
jgi:xylan 1,4-beta-xylosidase